jgi:hypothetical protein
MHFEPANSEIHIAIEAAWPASGGGRKSTATTRMPIDGALAARPKSSRSPGARTVL